MFFFPFSTNPAFNFIGLYIICLKIIFKLKTALVWVRVIDHKSSPLSHLTKVAVGVVEVPGNQDDHHGTDFNGGDDDDGGGDDDDVT